jgi:hypothetical protein
MGLVCLLFFAGIAVAQEYKFERLRPVLQPPRQFKYPSGIAGDTSENVYIADTIQESRPTTITPFPNVVVDPRIELFAVLLCLSDNPFIPPYNTPYKFDVLKYFYPFAEHPVVQWCREVWEETGFPILFSLPSAMLLLNPTDLSSDVHSTYYSPVVDEMCDFARETKFMDFFEAHKTIYHQMVLDVCAMLRGTDLIGTLENYFGMKQHSYNIMLSPLFAGGLNALTLPPGGSYSYYDSWDIYAICGFQDITRVAWHEFSHSFVAPILGVYGWQIAQYASLFDPIADKMEPWYPNWDMCVNEHIVRAITIRLSYREKGKLAGDLLLQDTKNEGFIYVKALCEQLEEYENQREKYPTFVDFFPELLKVFEELSEKRLSNSFLLHPVFRLPGLSMPLLAKK